ncbi:MAG: hypothetical protein AAGU11_16265 [Syntrophobacteraceae bacterium]
MLNGMGYTLIGVAMLLMTTALHADMLPSPHGSVMNNATIEEIITDEKKIDSFPTYRGRSYNRDSLTPIGHKAIAVETLPVKDMDDLNVRITASVTYKPDWREEFMWKQYGTRDRVPYYSFRVFVDDKLVHEIEESRKPTADFLHAVENRGYYSIQVNASALDSHLQYTIQRLTDDRSTTFTAAEGH